MQHSLNAHRASENRPLGNLILMATSRPADSDGRDLASLSHNWQMETCNNQCWVHHHNGDWNMNAHILATKSADDKHTADYKINFVNVAVWRCAKWFLMASFSSLVHCFLTHDTLLCWMHITSSAFTRTGKGWAKNESKLITFGAKQSDSSCEWGFLYFLSYTDVYWSVHKITVVLLLTQNPTVKLTLTLLWHHDPNSHSIEYCHNHNDNHNCVWYERLMMMMQFFMSSSFSLSLTLVFFTSFWTDWSTCIFL